MPTKSELEAELSATKKSAVLLQGQLDRAKKATKKAKAAAVELAADIPEPNGNLEDAAAALCDSIRKRGLDTQVGQKQLRLLVEAIGSRDYNASWREAPVPEEVA